MTYLFNCTDCEQQFEITEKQAGMEYACPFCEAKNVMPGMREIRRLPTKEPTGAEKPPKLTKQGEAGSWLFSGGLLVAVVAGLLGVALFSYAGRIAIDMQVDEKIEWGRTQVEGLKGGQLLDAWDSMAQGLPDWSESVGVRYNKQSGHLKNIAYGLFGLSALGFLALVGSFFGRRS